MLVFRKPRSRFEVHYSIPCVNCFTPELAGFKGGRNFLFGGSSSLCPFTPFPSSPPTAAPTVEGLVSAAAGEQTPPAVLVAGLEVPSCPLFVVVLSGVAAAAAAGAARARRPMADKVIAGRLVNAALLYGTGVE